MNLLRIFGIWEQDILAKTVTYSTSKDGPFNLVTIPASRAFEVYGMNKHGHKPERLLQGEEEEKVNRPEFSDGVGDEDLTRFDRRKKNKNRNRNHGQKARSKGNDQNPRNSNANPSPEAN